MKHDFKPYITSAFIESGSYVGHGIAKALEAGFSRVISIELSEYYYIFCKEKIQDERVTLIHGDSIVELPKVLENINERCTFWLDGHYMSDPRTANGIMPVPLMEELKAIKNHHIKNHNILIDDMRLLRNHEAEWKDLDYTLEDLMAFIWTINEDYTISFTEGYVDDDILIAEVK